MPDDQTKTLLLAANALYLNRFNFLAQLHLLPAESRKDHNELDRRDYSSFRRLRDCISAPGVIDDRIEKPFQHSGLFPWQDPDIQALIASDADIARLRLKDLPLSDAETKRIATANGGSISWQDREVPICRWSPGEVVWALREIVISRLEAEDEPSLTSTNEDSLASAGELHEGRVDPAAPLDFRRKGAARTIEALYAHFENSDRCFTAEDVKILVAELFDLTPNAANVAWRLAEIPKSEFKNLKKAKKIALDELRRTEYILRVKSDPQDIH